MAEFEMRGVFCQKSDQIASGWISARELGTDKIWVETPMSGAALSVEGARSMARNLYRLARRVEARNPPVEGKKS